MKLLNDTVFLLSICIFENSLMLGNFSNYIVQVNLYNTVTSYLCLSYLYIST